MIGDLSIVKKSFSFSEEQPGALPPFPRTFKRSSFGIKLGEKDLLERANGLNRWMQAVCQQYHQFSYESQVNLLFSILLMIFF